jgi:hypothetical protein
LSIPASFLLARRLEGFGRRCIPEISSFRASYGGFAAVAGAKEKILERLYPSNIPAEDDGVTPAIPTGALGHCYGIE